MVELLEDPHLENKRKALEMYDIIKSILRPEYSIYRTDNPDKVKDAAELLEKRGFRVVIMLADKSRWRN